MPSLKADVVDKAQVVWFTVFFVHAEMRAMLDRLTGTFIRSKEHKRQSQPYSKHIQLCSVNPSKLLSNSYSRNPIPRDFGSSIAERTEATD